MSELTLKAFSIVFTTREQQPELIYGVKKGGHGAAQHILVTTGLGHSHATRASLASVLKEREKSPNYRCRSRGREDLPPVQRDLWKLVDRKDS